MARQHIKVKAFNYGKPYEKGAGTSPYPLTWVDDPISGQLPTEAVMRYQVNVDVLGQPSTESEVAAIQGEALLVGLSYMYRIKNEFKRFRVEALTWLTLRDYYDDKAAGVRFTFTIVTNNPLNICDPAYDPAKQFPTEQPLPDFKTDNPQGCAIFNDTGALPNFTV